MILNMESISKDKAIKILFQKKISLFNVSDAKKIFRVKKDNTLYKLLERLEINDVIKRISKSKYLFLLFREINDFELANFLVTPSYISLESALSFYGVLPQFPYTITSVTSGKSKKVFYQDKEYEFVHLSVKYLISYIKKDNFLIATPEKALLDQLYFVAKKLRKIHFEDLDLRIINKKKFKNLTREYKFIPLQKLISKLKIC